MKGFYGALDFTGETRAGPFWWQILRGRKTQTIREPRADKRPHVKVGELVKLFWKMRTPEGKKPIHLIAYAKVLAYEKIRLLDLWYNEENARDDGFEDLEEFRLWFLPDWENFNDWEHEAILAASTLDQETILALRRGVGENPLSEAIDILTEPMMRIIFEIASTSKSTCALCGKVSTLDPVGDMTPKGLEYSGLAQCGNCSQISEITAFHWDKPQPPNIYLIK